MKFTFRSNVSLRIVDGEGVKIGDNVFFNNGTSIAAKEKIEIGDNCIFGENVKYMIITTFLRICKSQS